MEGRELEIKWLASTEEQLTALAQAQSLGGLPLTAAGENRHEDTYYDTSDFRLYRAGLSLRVRAKEGARQATVKEVKASVTAWRDRGEMTEDLLPARAIFHPDGAISRRLSPLLSNRTLDPVGRIRTHRILFSLGADAELALDRVVILSGDGKSTVGSFLEVEIEDRGAPAGTLDAAAKECLSVRGLLPSTQTKLERALIALGLFEQARGRERVFDLVPRRTDRLVDTAFRVLRLHFEKMKANEPGTRLGEDPEALHDMRVATRRLRAAFRTFAGALPEKRANAFVVHLRHIAAALGAVRDLDVYLGNIDAYAAPLPEEDRAHLIPFRRSLEKRRARARGNLLRTLDSRRYERFLTRFDAFLSRGPACRPTLLPAREPVLISAPVIVRRAFRRVARYGRSIHSRHPLPEELHRLRILGKRLRYAAEAFAPLYARQAPPLVARLTALQDLLGAHQDAFVAGHELRRLAAALPARGKQSLRTALAMGQLIRTQDEAAEAARAGFRKAWRIFIRRGLPACFR
jgi:CHAD domain-containing protein